MRNTERLILLFGLFCLSCYHPGYSPTSVQTQTTEVVLSGGEGSEILAEGVAAITGSVDIARDQALKDALRKAVEQGVGTFINSETRVENFQLLSDRIYSQAQGYVSSYRVVSESREADLYRVVVRAKVKLARIEDDLRAIGILVAEQGRPRVMVVVRKVANPGAVTVSEETMTPELVETMLTGAFQEKGFPVVDRATIEKNLNRERLRRILEGDTQAAILLGTATGAEIGVVGTLQEAIARKKVPYTQEERDYHRIELSARAINLNTGAVLGAGVVNAETPFSAEAARRTVADSISRILISRILTGWKRRENVTLVYARNADFQKVELFKSELRARVRGVNSVLTRELSGSDAVIEIVSETATPEVIEQIGSREMAVRFQIEGITGNRIDIRFLE
ncbi:MAG: flagellar assembly protein T N-terminal domain-containing protein [candidate division WOR-3 bacterium]|nr:flagellar assembly protein T N-terminal domain-containing protein [candidate division WOR-3 bacterium]MCR4424185.1 flagellar assembly protein T N-terminal domain-containing protein [candidate division WOR-3 bacterium]MDH7519396.1 flagellar assembly protein T N-terminal domain-containing protein [bacterium]